MKLTTKGLHAAEDGSRLAYDAIHRDSDHGRDPEGVLDNCRIIRELINPDIGEDESGVSSMPEVFTIEELKSKWSEVDVTMGEPFDVDEMVVKLLEQELLEA